jgi:hypothetical protein
MPCRAHTAPFRGLEKSLSERRVRGMARARHGMCESNTAALCKSNGKDTIETLSRTAWQGNGMGATWERHGVCELALYSFLMLSVQQKGRVECFWHHFVYDWFSTGVLCGCERNDRKLPSMQLLSMEKPLKMFRHIR